MKKILFIIILVILLSACNRKQSENKSMIQNIRKPAVAGQFYPDDADILKNKISKYIDKASKQEIRGDTKAILVPHAGLDYSGGVAANGYKTLENKKIENVIIICNSHSSFFSDIAIDDSDVWETPLGSVRVNKDLAKKLADSNKEIVLNSIVHESDHTLEVQLPFLQTILGDGFKIVPILFGNNGNEGYKKLAKALEESIGENDLIIISTDLSHYPEYKQANIVDQETLKMIEAGDVKKFEEYIKKIEKKGIPKEETLCCGIDAVKTIMELGKIMDWESKILKYANSGDTAGNKESVVGYGAMVFTQTQNSLQFGGQAKLKVQNENSKHKTDKELNENQKKQLLNIAKQTVEEYTKNGKSLDFTVTDERLNWKEGAFVTLHKDGDLRGCIGQIIPSEKPIWEVVRDMAIEAATDDPRFNPVSKNELEDIEYEVSVLSAPEIIKNWQDIELGKHGVIVKSGWNSGVFLPQVATETGWTREEFLSQLCSQKAGLAPDCYKNNPDVELLVFTAQVFK